jgi:hypothetical protein
MNKRFLDVFDSVPQLQLQLNIAEGLDMIVLWPQTDF